MPYIYIITNKINDKKYIGKTNRSIEERWKEHCKDRKRFTDRPLYRAMNKYGVENFKIEKLEEVSTDEEACAREEFWINYYNLYKCGYNATKGGDGRTYIDYDLVISTYEKFKNQKKTAEFLNISVDTVRKILKSNKQQITSSQEVIKKEYGEKVDMYDLSENYIKSFTSLRDAGKYLIDNNLTKCKLTTIRTHISEVCRGKRKTAANFIWKFSDKNNA